MTTPHPPALTELLDLARMHVDLDTVGHHVMHDPGTGGYINAFDDVLRRGAAAIEPSFDLVENLGPGVNWWTPEGDAHRWFRILTASVALHLLGEAFILAPHQLLLTLLLDALALPPSTGLRPLLGRLCREFTPRIFDPRERAAFILGELVLLGASRSTDLATIADRCAAIDRVAAACEPYYLPGHDWVPNPWHTPSLLVPWGWWSGRELHPIWFDLVTAHFPDAPADALALKQRILADGARWANKPRRFA